MSPQKMISYQKYIQLMKSQIFNWIMDANNQKLDARFYSTLFPEILTNSTIDRSTSLTNAIQRDWLKYS